jgi:hypothetical protein
MGALIMLARSPVALLLSLTCVTACADDDALEALPDASGGTVADAGDGDEADAAPGPDSGPATATAFAVATDFISTGIASTIAIPGLDVTPNAVQAVASTDPVVRRQGERVFIVNRFGQDNVTILDAASLTLVEQLSTGPGSNPQDVAAVGDVLFVAALAAPGVLVLDPDRPNAIDTIDLSDLDPADGLPDCGSIAAVGNRIVAVCAILDESFSPRGPGMVAVIDPARRTVVDRVAMTQVRPFGLAQVAADVLLVTTVDDFGTPAGGGCVERIAIDKAGGRSGGCLVENADLGGFASAVAPDPAGDRLWMTVTTSFDPKDLGPRGELVSVPADGAEVVRHELAEEVRPMDLALCPTGHLVVADATQGVRVLAPDAGDELTRGPLDIGLPPVSNGIICF